MTVTAFSLYREPVRADIPESPGWWLRKLAPQLTRKRERLQRLHDYASGNAPLVDIAPAAREAYLQFQRRARTNFADLAVETLLDRTKVAGIRTGAEGDRTSDSEAWDWWQANQLDADSIALHRAAFVMGEAFAIVGEGTEETGGLPLVTVEDPRKIVAAVDPLRRRSLRVALKQFTDPWTERTHSYLYLRGEGGARATVWHAEHDPVSGNQSWIGDPEFLPFSRIPVVWFPNLLDVDGFTTWGEFEKHTDVLDRITSSVLQRVVTASMQAFRQRILKNLPAKDENGEAINYDGMFPADPAALWTVPADVEVWESQLTDIMPMLMAARDDIKDFAAVTRTPLPALVPDAANQSAANTELVRSGLIFKAVDRMASLSESWEEVLRLRYAWEGDPRASRTDTEILWQAPDIPSLSERFDAASKAAAAGLPDEYIRLNILGMTPQEIARYAAAEAAGPSEEATFAESEPETA